MTTAADAAEGDLSRRQFLSGVAAVAGALAVGGCGDGDGGGPAATSTPTAQPSASSTATPPASATATASRTSTAPPTASATASPTRTATPSPADTASASPTPSATDSATASPTDTATPTPSDSPSPTPTSTSMNPESLPLPLPAQSGIEHVIVVMMENRSFDHFLGWLPGADGRQAGLTFIDKNGEPRPTHPLAPNFQNCESGDPDHSYAGGRLQLNGGACDGWLRARTNDVFPIGYYEQADLAFYGPAVPAWTTCDRYFCAILGPTFPNRIYMHAAQTDRLSNTFTQSFLPTIWDRLAAAGRSGRYYSSDLPVLALWGETYRSITTPIAQFFDDARAGALANVSYLDPRFLGAGEGLSNDDHPFADIRNGQAFVGAIYDAVINSPTWENTVLIITYDEWGGFFDHVPPPQGPLTELDVMLGNDGRLGFRVPCIVISPLARRGFIGHREYDHTSVLSLIEWRWGLAPLTVRDATANNLAHVLDFQSPKNLDAPRIDVPTGPFGAMCPAESESVRVEHEGLRYMALRHGFIVRR